MPLQTTALTAESNNVQIGHSIRSCDVPSLYRDFGIVIVNVVDTEVGFLCSVMSGAECEVLVIFRSERRQ